jgi:glycosyltransferase involved in cell wall biosynthesis
VTHRARRVCLITETYHPEVGGGETQARLLAAGLIERGWSVRLVTRRSRRGTARREEIDGVAVRRLAPAGAGRLKKWGMAPGTLLELLRERESYDLIFVSGFRVLGIPATAAGLMLARPCVLKPDSLGEMSGAWYAPGLAASGIDADGRWVTGLLAARNRLLRRASAFVAISSPVERELLSCGVGRRDIHRIPNGIDVQRFRPASVELKRSLRARLGLPADGPVVTYCGRLVSYKGLPGLIRAWKRVAPRFPGAVLQLVGSGSLDLHNVEQELARQVAAEGLSDSVRLPGAVDDVPERLQASDLFVFPVRQEAFGLALVEAMACGLAAVTTRAGGLADVVTDGQDALTIPEADDDALAGALETLLGDPALRARLGAAARRTAEARFGAAAVADHYDAMFRALVARYESARGAATPLDRVT